MDERHKLHCTHSHRFYKKKLDDDGNINELCNNNIIMYAGDSISDLLALCQADIGFIVHSKKSKQSHRMTANKFGMQLHSLSKIIIIMIGFHLHVMVVVILIEITLQWCILY